MTVVHEAAEQMFARACSGLVFRGSYSERDDAESYYFVRAFPFSHHLPVFHLVWLNVVGAAHSRLNLSHIEQDLLPPNECICKIREVLSVATGQPGRIGWLNDLPYIQLENGRPLAPKTGKAPSPAHVLALCRMAQLVHVMGTVTARRRMFERSAKNGLQAYPELLHNLEPFRKEVHTLWGQRMAMLSAPARHPRNLRMRAAAKELRAS